MLTYTTRPISDRTWLNTIRKEATRFSAKWSDTLTLLETEVAILKGRDVVLECDVREQDLRLDGTLRANARPSSPAVVVAFESKHGPLLYRCDRFYANWSHQGPDWQHNVWANALTLQALRAVDRYGATETGQQYTGYKQLGAGTAMPASHMTSDQAWVVLAEVTGFGLTVAEVADPDELRSYFREARRATHPDRVGDRSQWDQVEEAGKVLGLVS